MNNPRLKRFRVSTINGEGDVEEKDMQINKLTVYSFYHELMTTKVLYGVVYVDQYQSHQHISNLAPLRSLGELQFFMRKNLHEIIDRQWGIAISKDEDEGVDLSRYLVSEDSNVFSLVRKLFLYQSTTKEYAWYSVCPTGNKDDQSNCVYISSHMPVAAACYPTEAHPVRDAHHKDHHPLHHHCSNLQWLTEKEHNQIHMDRIIDRVHHV